MANIWTSARGELLEGMARREAARQRQVLEAAQARAEEARMRDEERAITQAGETSAHRRFQEGLATAKEGREALEFTRAREAAVEAKGTRYKLLAIYQNPNEPEQRRREAAGLLGITQNVFPDRPKAPEPFNLSPDERRFSPEGKVIAQGGPRTWKPDDGPNMTATAYGLPVEAQSYIASLPAKHKGNFEAAQAELINNLPKMAAGNPFFNSQRALVAFRSMFANEPGVRPEAGAAGPLAGTIEMRNAQGRVINVPPDRVAAAERDGFRR